MRKPEFVQFEPGIRVVGILAEDFLEEFLGSGGVVFDKTEESREVKTGFQRSLFGGDA